MKLLINRNLQITLLLICTPFMFIQAQSDSISFAHFSLDACAANFGLDQQKDYSEFTAHVDNSGSCANLSVIGDYLYVEDPEEHPHSCTPGVDGDAAMCVGAHSSCGYFAGSDRSVRVDVLVSPGEHGLAVLSGLSFYEKAPAQYTWINGGVGPNNYPTLFRVRILKGDSEVYRSDALATQLAWNLREFDFSEIEAFTVTEPTVFHVELLSYCPVGNGASTSAWDLDELRLSVNCCLIVSGGELTGGPFEFCVGDGTPDFVSGVDLTGNIGSTSQIVVTDEDGMILGLPPAADSVDFDGAGAGTCLIWNVSYFGSLDALALGNNVYTDLPGDCFGISNAITVVRNQQPEGGALTGGPFTFCVGDGVADNVSGVNLTDATGENSQYLVTDTLGNILGLPTSPEDVDFDGAGPGVCLIWHLSYDGTITGLEMGENVANVAGCFGLSNALTVNRNALPDGGELSGGPFEFCVGDGVADNVSGVAVSGNTGANGQYVVTSDANVILGLPGVPEEVDFDGAGVGVCLIWHLSYAGDISGLELGNNLMSDVTGCFALSNSVTVNRTQPNGGTLTGGPFEFCVGDSVADHVSGIVLEGATGASSQYVVTDSENMILGLPPHPDSVNFDGAGAGTCLIWHLSYDGDVGGLELNGNLGDLTGCFGLSNAVAVIRNQPEGGELTGGPFEFCVDSLPDFVDSVALIGNSGGQSQYVVTDTLGMILGLPPAPDSVDFNAAGPGVCLIWHVSFAGDSLGGLTVGANTADLAGCFDFSNPITVTRIELPCGDSIGGPPIDLDLAPNPTYDFVQLEFENTGKSSVTVHIYDIYGRLCLWENCDPSYDLMLDLSGLPEGQYYVSVTGTNGRKTKSMILLR